MGEKEYIGDGVYADRDDRGLVLTTENGIRVTNEIILEPEVLSSLVRYAQRRGLIAVPQESEGT